MAQVRKMLYGDHDPYKDAKIYPFNSHGWASHSPAFKRVIEEVKPHLIIEVGTWLGASARNMARLASQINSNIEVVCVDTFLGSVEHWNGSSYKMEFHNGRPNIYDQFLSNVIHDKLTEIITPFPIDSINGYEVLKNYGVVADLIYIDAGHDYASVKADLDRWSKLVRVGGVLMGDDFHHPPIIKAVKETFNVYTAMGEKFIWHNTGTL